MHRTTRWAVPFGHVVRVRLSDAHSRLQLCAESPATVWSPATCRIRDDLRHGSSAELWRQRAKFDFTPLSNRFVWTSGERCIPARRVPDGHPGRRSLADLGAMRLVS